MSFLTVRGMQASGLITCAKHYVLYEQEPVCTGPVVDGSRTECLDVDSVVDGEASAPPRFMYQSSELGQDQRPTS